jgi:hypothetical protein
MLAVCLGHLEAARILIKAGADVNTETEGWTVVQVLNKPWIKWVKRRKLFS